MLLIVAGVLLLVALIRWQTTLSFLGRYLIYSQAPESADIILVLAGGLLWPSSPQGSRISEARVRAPDIDQWHTLSERNGGRVRNLVPSQARLPNAFV